MAPTQIRARALIKLVLIALICLPVYVVLHLGISHGTLYRFPLVSKRIFVLRKDCSKCDIHPPNWKSVRRMSDQSLRRLRRYMPEIHSVLSRAISRTSASDAFWPEGYIYIASCHVVYMPHSMEHFRQYTHWNFTGLKRPIS